MPRGVRHQMHSGVSSIALLGDMSRETIAKPTRVGQDSNCGFPGHALSSQQMSTDFPPDIAPVYSKAHWDRFLAQINDALISTSVPDFPCILTACLPPACLLFWWCRKARSKDRVELIQHAIEVENDRLLHQGLVWTEPVFHTRSMCGIKRIPELRSSIHLQLDVVKRTEYELDNPQMAQFLAEKLLERSEKQLQATTNPLTPTSAKQPEFILDEAQQKLLTRQVTIQRRNSVTQHSTSRTNETPHDPTAATHSPAHAPHITPQAANERWAEPVKPNFQAIVPDETPSPPTKQTMQ